jgi:hypothetical protein
MSIVIGFNRLVSVSLFAGGNIRLRELNSVFVSKDVKVYAVDIPFCARQISYRTVPLNAKEKYVYKKV